MLEEAGIAIAVEDARARHEAVVSLMLNTDQQAITLLQMYLTLATATAAGGVAAFAGTFLPSIAGWSLLGGTGTLVVGSAFCFFAMQTTEVNAPGKAPEFWLWALQNDGVDLRLAAAAYMEQLAEGQNKNRRANRRSARRFWFAKICGLITPVAALVFGSLGWLLGS